MLWQAHSKNFNFILLSEKVVEFLPQTGCWRFAAIGHAQTEAELAKAAEKAVAMAKANAMLSQEPVQLADGGQREAMKNGANFAGTSFATLDKWKSKSFNYGSQQVNLFADKTQAGTLGPLGLRWAGLPVRRVVFRWKRAANSNQHRLARQRNGPRQRGECN